MTSLWVHWVSSEVNDRIFRSRNCFKWWQIALIFWFCRFLMPNLARTWCRIGRMRWLIPRRQFLISVGVNFWCHDCGFFNDLGHFFLGDNLIGWNIRTSGSRCTVRTLDWVYVRRGVSKIWVDSHVTNGFCLIWNLHEGSHRSHRARGKFGNGLIARGPQRRFLIA